MSIGEYLKRTRLEKRLDLAEVSQELHIRQDYLEALEQDRWDRLPGEVYGIGFLRSYARHLEVDAEALVKYRRRLVGKEETPTKLEESSLVLPTARRRRTRERAPQSPKSRTPRSSSSQAGSGRGVFWAALVLVALFVAGLWKLDHPGWPAFLAQGKTPPSAHVKPPKKMPRSSPTTPSSSQRPQTPTITLISNNQAQGDLVYQVSSGPLDVHLTFTGLCWLEVWKNGVLQNPSGTSYNRGQTATFTASSSVEIWTGTRTYTLTVDNQAISIPDPTQHVLHVTFQKS